MTQEEFSLLFDTNFAQVRNYVFFRSGNTEVATDIAQEVFLKIWEKRHSVQYEKVKGLLFKVANDLFLKKEYKNNMVWVSYTLSKTEEGFPFYVKDFYKPAPHHQTHEVKFAGILNLGSFYISVNYIYGSGFERFDFETEEGLELDKDYKRLDAAVVYRFRPGKIKAEIRLSVLNILDEDNIKYSNLRRTTVDDISLVGIYADAVPFTPAIFLNIEL